MMNSAKFHDYVGRVWCDFSSKIHGERLSVRARSILEPSRGFIELGPRLQSKVELQTWELPMPFKSKTYRVLIASPSDLAEERQAATEAVNEWNAQHAVAEAAVLLPVKWETHALPTSGARPQAVINEQLVDHCDILIGMFWTKLGTST